MSNFAHDPNTMPLILTLHGQVSNHYVASKENPASVSSLKTEYIRKDVYDSLMFDYEQVKNNLAVLQRVSEDVFKTQPDDAREVAQAET
jgi:hypothetical protein